MSSAIRSKKWRLKQKEGLGVKGFNKIESLKKKFNRQKKKLLKNAALVEELKRKHDPPLKKIPNPLSLDKDIFSKVGVFRPCDICENYHVFRHPATVLVAGPTFSGKSHLMRQILENKDQMLRPPVEEVIWCYGIESPQLVSLKEKFPDIKLHRGLPDLDRLASLPKGVKRALVIDDLMNETKGNVVSNLFTKIAHHMDISVFYLCQNVLNNNKEMRNIFLNAMYKVLFYNPGDLTQITLLNNRMYPGHPKFLRSVLKEVAKEPHGFMLLDQHPLTPDDLRVKSHVFPNNHFNYIYLPPLLAADIL